MSSKDLKIQFDKQFCRMNRQIFSCVDAGVISREVPFENFPVDRVAHPQGAP